MAKKDVKKEATWEEVIEPLVMPVDDRHQIQFGVSKMSDDSMEARVNIRCWEKYATKEERAAGQKWEDMDYRPTQKGFTIPMSMFNDFCANTNALQEFLVYEGILELENAEE